jgi:acyl carrier protein
MPSCPSTGSPVLAEITDIFRDLLCDPTLELSVGTTPDDVPGWDSMTHIAVVVEAECRFGVQFHTAEIEQLRNVGDLVRHVEMKQTQAAA